ncbi:glycosyltransferase involved in cell wall biosynthesis [Pararhizobium capsulatum DSM 1112]|uniref:Glycosyltransferase involved in cell wall biosynthesis n=1 Tax=Pararhizobium capsulatum DSM 1112 TaxID=1121113 RepID=A0ABU0BS85_9HYPH|nr:glycosyltransferase family 4 protein [Pararhizobium capsulatum]MDQ0321103.1 glycosyltransferase involved in cell wall biosynthesis [Pararhizobium capsulatum DSM 1112]
MIPHAPSPSQGHKLRIAQVVTRMDIGGVPDHVMTLVQGLSNHAEVTVIGSSIDPQHERALTNLGVPFLPVPMERSLSPLSDIRSFGKLRKALRDGAFDIVHTHMSKAAMLGGLASATSGIPVTINTAHNLGFLALSNPAARGLFWIYDRLLFALTTDAVITVSGRVRDGIIRSGIAPGDKVVSIHNGIEAGRFPTDRDRASAIRHTFGIEDSHPLIVTVARLVWFKGLHDLIDAAALVLEKEPNARFLIVGSGPQLDELRAKTVALGIADRVIFAGERRDVPDILSAADIFALTSVSEGLPISILEAMAAGLPVVATDVGGISELVAEGETGFLVPAREPREIANRILRLTADAGLRQSFGTAGRDRVTKAFSPEQMVTQTTRLYHQLLAAKAAGREPRYAE